MYDVMCGVRFARLLATGSVVCLHVEVSVVVAHAPCFCVSCAFTNGVLRL